MRWRQLRSRTREYDDQIEKLGEETYSEVGCWLAHIGSKVHLCGGDAFDEQHDAGAGRAPVFDWQRWLSNGRGPDSFST